MAVDWHKVENALVTVFRGYGWALKRHGSGDVLALTVTASNSTSPHSLET